jgi:hypothetical protein
MGISTAILAGTRFADGALMARRRWVVDSVVLLVAAYLQASILVRCTSALLSTTDIPEALDPSPHELEHERQRGTVQRNPFESTSSVVVSGCDGVVASIISKSSDPEHSLASLRGFGTVRAGTRFGGKRVVEIDDAAVLVDDGLTQCRAPLAPVGVDQPVQAKPERVAERRTLSRKLRERLLSDPRQLLAGAEVVPEREGKRIAALRIAALSSGALLETLGLRAGDRLRSINRISMVDPSDMAKLWLSLSRAEVFNVEVERDGARIDLDVRIQ